MNLTIKNRLILLQILPIQGSLSEMVDVLELAKQLKLTDEEKKLINYTEDNDKNSYWDLDKDFEKDFQLTTDMIAILKNIISKLDEEKKLPLVMVDLALKINNL